MEKPDFGAVLARIREKSERLAATPWPDELREHVDRVEALIARIEVDGTDPDAELPALLTSPPTNRGWHEDVRAKHTAWVTDVEDRMRRCQARFESAFRAGRNDAQRLWEPMAERIGIPRRLRTATFSRAIQTPTVERGRAFVEDGYVQGSCLVLMGQTGVGKSFVAAAILRAVRDPNAKFVYFPALCARLLDAARRDDALRECGIVRDGRDIDRSLVVWDDFGAEYIKPGGMLEGVIDELFWLREAEELPTLLTTNLKPEEFRERVSHRIADRLRGGWGEIFAARGESLRGSA